jgi:hypothetical protein
MKTPYTIATILAISVLSFVGGRVSKQCTQQDPIIRYIQTNNQIKKYKMKLIVLMCLFALMSLQCHAQLEIQSEPCTIHDSCGVVYTHKQDERCLLTFIKVAKQDSIISLYEEQHTTC